ncbi:MAG TPA: SRPBCC family protein [Streptosporangiaceae bacterium]
MPVITCTATTAVSPDRVLAALTDFTADRPRIWPGLDPRFYQVHRLGETSAEVTEGSSFAGGVWERARYDWSGPGLVRITVLDSNAFAPGGSWTYQVAPASNGSRVSLTVKRRGRTVKGRLLAALLHLTGRPVFCGDLRKALAGLAAA